MSSHFNAVRERRKWFDNASIDRLVRLFYERVRSDEFIGPVFHRRIHDWEPHLQQMVAFWTAVLRGEACYTPGPKGRPPQRHQAIEGLELAHFGRWLSLFEMVAHEVFEPDAADFVIDRSQRMARALSAHLPNE